jgi:HAMP domain-containing protein
MLTKSMTLLEVEQMDASHEHHRILTESHNLKSRLEELRASETRAYCDLTDTKKQIEARETEIGKLQLEVRRLTSMKTI